MLLALSILGLALAALFAVMVAVNLTVLRPPEGEAEEPVSILIPARDEAGNIRAALDAAPLLGGRVAAVVVGRHLCGWRV